MNQQNSSTDGLLPDVIKLAHRAGREILEVYNTDFSVDQKGDDSPLTAADLASHQSLCQGLATLTPELPVFSEESATIPFATRSGWQQYWLIDPLDGTREFIKRNGEFTVNIALIEGHQPVLGVVHIPVSGDTYYAARGYGAFLQKPGKTVKPIHVRKTSPGAFVVAGSRSHATERQIRFLEILGDNIKMHAIGSSLKFCLVAEGSVDLYPRFGPTSEWDTAAAHCLVEEAGGIVTDLKFRPLEYNQKESVINPDFLVIADPGFDWGFYLDQLDSGKD